MYYNTYLLALNTCGTINASAIVTVSPTQYFPDEDSSKDSKAEINRQTLILWKVK